MITKKDMTVIEFIDKFKVANTSTIQELFYPSIRSAQRRLKVMVDYKELYRDRDYFTYEYIYYKKRTKQLKHRLILTNLYRELHKRAEIVTFENEFTINNIRADAFLAYKTYNKSIIAFVEVQICESPLDIEKYIKLLKSGQYKKYFPVFPKLIAITNQRLPEVEGIQLIQLKCDLSDIDKLL